MHTRSFGSPGALFHQTHATRATVPGNLSPGGGKLSMNILPGAPKLDEHVRAAFAAQLLGACTL